MKNRIIIAMAFLLLSITANAQYGLYKYKRELHGVDGAWHQFSLPAGIYQKISPGFSDIRIISIPANQDTVEIPYLLHVASEKKEKEIIPFQLVNQSTNDKGYFYSFEVKGQPFINELSLDFNKKNFDWKVNLEGSHDLQQWFRILQDYRVVSFKNEEAEFAFTKLIIPPSRYSYYRLQVKAAQDPLFKKAILANQKQGRGNLINYKPKQVSIQNVKRGNITMIDIDLPHVLPICMIKIFADNPYDYYRQLSVGYLTDSFKTETGWHYNFKHLMHGTINSFEKNEFVFNSTIFKKMKVLIENLDNEPLQIDSVQVSGYEHIIKARFPGKGSSYILYGNSTAGKPAYDIEKFPDKIPDSMPTIRTGEEIIIHPGNNKRPAFFQDKKWLWLLMALIIFVLGWFTLNMIKKKNKE